MDHPTTAVTSWTPGQRVAFRFFCLLFPLYIFFNPNGVLPFSDLAYDWYIQPFHSLAVWTGKHILHLSYPITVFTNGSGDTTYDYVIILIIFVLSVVGCLIWTLLDRQRSSYSKLYYWLVALVRYYLAVTMLSYGYAKLFKLQFPAPNLYRLVEPYGNSSPMGLAWTYMGYSVGFNIFTGFAEVLSGILLLFRRTTAVGAFLSFMVAGHIMAMNYCYDIPVKLLSTAMVIMALFLLARNIQVLFALFFGSRTVCLSVVQPVPIRKRSWFLTLRIFKILLILYVVGFGALSAISNMKEYGPNAPKTPLYGIYNVKTFVRNKDTVAPMLDSVRWKQIYIDGTPSYSYGRVQTTNDSSKNYAFRPDTVGHLLTIFSYADTTKKYRFHYEFPTKDSLVLVGNWKNDSVWISFKRYDVNNFLLLRRGYHWINEYPYNR